METGSRALSLKIDMRPWSARMALLIAVLVVAYRIYTLGANELSWDVFGYYLYLPASFIHHDPLLKDIGWIHQVMAERPISGTLYQLGSGPDSNPVYFFLMGMALLYMPFFLVGHAIAALTGQPMDGFSLPYQYAIALGCVSYTVIALVHLRRILLAFFPDRLIAFLLVVIALGTNWFHFMTLKNLETANVLFMLMTVLVWNTLRWHRTERRRNLVWVALSLGLITLVKPSEVLVLLIPLLWGVYDIESLAAKRRMLWRLRGQVLFAMGICLLVVLPQMIYWMVAVGTPIYDSYKNPGIGLDLWSPHLLDAFFSYRKGWLVYTPIMVFALLGLIFLHRRQRTLFPAIVIWFLASTWIVVSWTEWWYGASFSVRPMITSYVVLSLPLGYFVQAHCARGALWRIGLYGCLGALVALNLFQMWQHHHGVLDPYRTTRAYYWSIFGRTSVPEGAERLKSIERSFTGEHAFTDRQNYRKVVVRHLDFETLLVAQPERQQRDSLAGSTVYRMDGDMPYSPTIRSTYDRLTDSDHAWIHASMKLFVPKDFHEEMPCLVFSVDRAEGSYAYNTICPDITTFERGQWAEIAFDQLLPPIRSGDDELKCYAWCRSRSPILIDDLALDIYLPNRSDP